MMWLVKAIVPKAGRMRVNGETMIEAEFRKLTGIDVEPLGAALSFRPHERFAKSDIVNVPIIPPSSTGGL